MLIEKAEATLNERHTALAKGEAALEGAAGESLERHGPTSLS